MVNVIKKTLWWETHSISVQDMSVVASSCPTLAVPVWIYLTFFSQVDGFRLGSTLYERGFNTFTLVSLAYFNLLLFILFMHNSYKVH